MLTNFSRDENGNLVKQEAYSLLNPIWCDILNPTHEERMQIQTQNGIVLPQHNETIQIEYSNRFYEENGALYLSVNVLVKAAPYPESHVVTFILTKEKVFTLRYSNPNPVNSLTEKLKKRQYHISDQFDVLILLLHEMVGNVANIFEMLGTSTDLLALSLMQTIDNSKRRDHGRLLNKALIEISRFENVLSKGYQSLSSLNLLASYFERSNNEQYISYFKRLDSLIHDVTGLMKYSDYLSHKLEFQLDSTLGLLNIEQTYIIKIFTFLAMVFMPPTLLASIWGMNFHHMPELDLRFAYPVGLFLMVLSSLLPYRFFKKRGWI